MHVLFLIHGMGTHNEEDWSETIQESLLENANRYRWFSENDISDYVEFCPVSYDHVYENFLDQWQENSGIINEIETDDEFNTSDYLGWLSDMGEEERRFYWSHLADVIIYRFIPLYRDRIRIELIKQLATKIDEYQDKYRNRIVDFSVAAHSLGTAVTHDCLHLLGTTQWDEESGIDNVFGPEHFKFKSLFMFANTSRLLQSDIDVYQSIVRPPAEGSDGSGCFVNQYFNVLHKYDPVTFFRQFDPGDWGSAYKNISLAHIRQQNIHAYDHYFDHPAVHIPLFRDMIDRWAVTQTEAEEAIKSYQDVVLDEELFEDINEITARLDDFRQSANDLGSVTEFIKQLVEFRKILKSNSE